MARPLAMRGYETPSEPDAILEAVSRADSEGRIGWYSGVASL
jgi:hypothetical protein